MPKLSIAVPIYDMPNGEFFYRRLVKSLDEQTFTDWELVVTKEGKMAENTNAAILACKGDYIKVLYQDDYLAHPEALQKIVDALKDEPQWLVTGCNHDNGADIFNDHLPSYEDIKDNINSIGSPSVMTIKNDNPLLFDKRMSWMLDVDYYKRMLEERGAPVLLNDINVTIGVGEHQMTNILTDEEKMQEQILITEKYDPSNRS